MKKYVALNRVATRGESKRTHTDRVRGVIAMDG